MIIKKIAIIYTLFIGISMSLMWLIFLFNDQIPELRTAPIEIIYHLAAEFVTAGLLIGSGFGLFLNKKWGFQLYLFSMGMLFYTVIVSAGYYANLQDYAMVGMFTSFQIATFLLILISFFRKSQFHSTL